MVLRFIQTARCIAVALLPLALVSCQTLSTGDGPVPRAVTALGGTAALENLKTIEASGTARHWEPDSSFVALGEPRLADESAFTLQRDLARPATRIDWQRKFVYLGPREFRFTEIVADGVGYVSGIDSNARTKQNLDAKPPAHTMSPVRLATTTRDLVRSSPALLLEMQRNPGQVTAVADTIVQGRPLPTVRYRPAGRDFLVMFDPTTGLPARIRTLDYNPSQGDSTYDLVLSDWRDVAGVKFPYRQVYELNGTTVIDTRFEKVQGNPAIAGDRFAIPAEFVRRVALPAEPLHYQWVLKRQYIGILLDTDALYFDPAASKGMTLQEIAPGVLLTQGVTHNSMVVEMADHLIVFEAPINDGYSKWVLAELKKRYPNKPVRTLVLSHHHMDHTWGTRAYLAQGATLVTNTGNGAMFRGMAQAVHTRSPDLPGSGKFEPKITEVSDRLTLTDGKRNVHVVAFANPHSAGALIGYVEDARLGFVTDVWSPGRDPVGAQLNAGQMSLVNAVRKAGFSPERFAGGHGSVAPYAELESKAK
jgi:glyoxylase-like metal-dependent hydrolase (beta-lactamase superfamily II)